MKISDALGVAAKEAGMRDVQIAAAVGVTQAAVCRWRSGKTEPRATALMRLRRLLPKFADLIDESAV